MYMNTRSVKDFFVFGFMSYGIIWTIVDAFGTFFEDRKPEGVYWYVVFVFIPVVFGLLKCRPSSHVELKVPFSDSSVEVTFGDIFEGKEVVVIPVNEYFDGLIGDHVSKSSLHGKFILKFLDGQLDTFERLTDETLKSIESCYVERESGRTNKYPIGTVAKVDTGGKRFLLAALSKTDVKSLKASATLDDLWDCLEGIWKGIRDYHNGNLVKVPLLGSGLSGVGLPPKVLIGIIMTSFFSYTKKCKIADKVTLVLPYRLKGKIDLTAIERSWK